MFPFPAKLFRFSNIEIGSNPTYKPSNRIKAMIFGNQAYKEPDKTLDMKLFLIKAYWVDVGWLAHLHLKRRKARGTARTQHTASWTVAETKQGETGEIELKSFSTVHWVSLSWGVDDDLKSSKLKTRRCDFTRKSKRNQLRKSQTGSPSSWMCENSWNHDGKCAGQNIGFPAHCAVHSALSLLSLCLGGLMMMASSQASQFRCLPTNYSAVMLPSWIPA